MDLFLLEHFTKRVSRILTLFDDDSNPFHDYLLPLAMQHSTLMHSLLALSSSHLANTSDNPDYKSAQCHHLSEALSTLRTGLDKGPDNNYVATSLIL